MEHPAIVTHMQDGAVAARDLPFHQSGQAITVWAEASFEAKFEGLVAERLGDSTARLRSVPVLTPGLRLDDIVGLWVDEDTGAEVIDSIVEQSRYATYLVRLNPASERDTGPLWTMMSELSPAGCWFDAINETLVGVAAPGTSDTATSSEFDRLVGEGVVVDWMRWDVPSDGTVGVYTR